MEVENNRIYTSTHSSGGVRVFYYLISFNSIYVSKSFYAVSLGILYAAIKLKKLNSPEAKKGPVSAILNDNNEIQGIVIPPILHMEDVNPIPFISVNYLFTIIIIYLKS